MSVVQHLWQTKNWAFYSLDAITLDDELQPRAELDDALLESIAEALTLGELTPPVTAFDDGQVLWLADGYHRWHAHKALDIPSIAVSVLGGKRDDALLYSLSANARHGKRPNERDLRRAYKIAVAHGFLNPALENLTEKTATLLHCTHRWASTLTAEDRERRHAGRNAEIVRLKGEGKTHREVAEKLHISPQTVTNVQKRNPSENGRPDPDRAAKQAAAAELLTEPAREWHRVVDVLRAINTLQSVEWLFENEFRKYDHVITDELGRALQWLQDFDGRFGNVRNA